jgi:hypothetical protein
LCNPCDEDEKDDQFFFSLFQVMEHQWNEIDRGKPKYSGKNLFHCHFVHHKSHMDCSWALINSVCPSLSRQMSVQCLKIDPTTSLHTHSINSPVRQHTPWPIHKQQLTKLGILFNAGRNTT